MSIGNYLSEIVFTEEFVPVMVFRDDSGKGDAPGEDGDGYEYLANEECINKMRQPVVCNGHDILNTVSARTILVNLSWYIERPELEGSDFWSEAAIRKMREPTGHGYPRLLTRSTLEKLMTLI